MTNNKQYTWGADEKFVLSGNEFSLMLNTFRAILSTEQAAQILLADRAHQVLEKKMEEGIESGIIKEVVEPNKEE